MDATESILNSVKVLLGILPEYKHFDVQLILHINSVLGILRQLGVGPKEGFSISNEDAIWSEFLGDQAALLDLAKSYTYMKVRLMFDPPQATSAIEAINRQISECEFRLMIEADQNDEQEGADDE